MSKNKRDELIKAETADITLIENGGQVLFNKISTLIEQSRQTMYTQVNSTTVLLFWEIGNHINIDILENKRADYGKKNCSAACRKADGKTWAKF